MIWGFFQDICEEKKVTKKDSVVDSHPCVYVYDYED